MLCNNPVKSPTKSLDSAFVVFVFLLHSGAIQCDSTEKEKEKKCSKINTSTQKVFGCKRKKSRCQLVVKNIFKTIKNYLENGERHGKIERVSSFGLIRAVNTPNVKCKTYLFPSSFSCVLDTECVERESRRRIVKTKPERIVRASHRLSLKSKETNIKTKNHPQMFQYFHEL